MKANLKVEHIELPAPKIGGKIWLLNRPGIFVLERGPGVFRTAAITHAGTGGLRIYDGIPDEEGHFAPAEEGQPENGRKFFHQQPIVMGSWMCDGGFHHGLTVVADAGGHNVTSFASIVWVPYKVRS